MPSMSAAELQERVLATWMPEEAPDEIHIYYQTLRFTAEYNGIKLYTALKRVMDRPAPYMPYQEVDGLAYMFVDSEGRLCCDFSGKLGGSVYQDTFAFNAEKHGTALAQARWAVEPRPVPEQKAYRAPRPR